MAEPPTNEVSAAFHHAFEQMVLAGLRLLVMQSGRSPEEIFREAIGPNLIDAATEAEYRRAGVQSVIGQLYATHRN